MKLATIAPHPSGGYTLAIPLNQHSSTRIYRDWFPSKEAAALPLKRENIRLRRRYRSLHRQQAQLA